MALAWKPARFSHEERMRCSETLTRRLLAKHGKKIRAVALEGSTSKGLDRPESDLELKVVVQDMGFEHRWYPFFRQGMFYDPGDLYKLFTVPDDELLSVTTMVSGAAYWAAITVALQNRYSVQDAPDHVR